MCLCAAVSVSVPREPESSENNSEQSLETLCSLTGLFVAKHNVTQCWNEGFQPDESNISTHQTSVTTETPKAAATTQMSLKAIR